MKITLLTGKTFDIEKSFDFPLKVIKSDSSKRLTLRIDSKERIPILTIPKRCSERRAVEFVKNHQDWIFSSLAKLPEAKRFADNTTISVFGQLYTIKHTPDLKQGTFIDGDILLVSGAPEFIHRRIKDFIKEQAKKELTNRSQILAKQLKMRLNNVVIKDTKSRWGSCSSNNNINYSWRIALAPIESINYLVAHEVSHLKHQDHSTSFWNCVENLYKDAKIGRAWLKKNGKELYQYE